MKKENLQMLIVGTILIGASFYSGYCLSPNNKDYYEQKAEIQQLQEVIVQQQLIYQNLIKHLPQFKTKNWSMNQFK